MSGKNFKNKLTKDVWSKNEYYDIAKKGSEDLNHPAMIELKNISKNARKLLDMGCGEGTRLANIADKHTTIFGIDISSTAIKKAKKKYPKFNFVVGDLEKLPFPDNEFDLVYSAFVFEHLDNPKKVIKEGVRVLKPGGSFLIAAPNYGAPNRASPPFKGNRILKLFEGFVKDFIPVKGLGWHKVKPIADINTYGADWDTTIEPYMGSLIKYLKSRNLRIIHATAGWGMERAGASSMQKIIRGLGETGIYPFKYWGPHFVLVTQKPNRQ